MTTTQREAREWAIGVDVGRTRVAAGFVDACGEIHQHTRVPMNSHGTAEEGLAAVTAAIDELLKLTSDKNSAARYGVESGIAGGAALCIFPGASE